RGWSRWGGGGGEGREGVERRVGGGVAEHTLAPPAGTAGPIAVVALRRARHNRLDRGHGRRREGRRGRSCVIAQRLGRRLAHGRAPPWRFGCRRFGNSGAGDLRRWRLLWPRCGRGRHIVARLASRFGAGDRCFRRLGRGNRSRPVEIVDGAREFGLRRNFPREALAVAAATVAPSAPPSAAPPPALAVAIAMRLCRPFGAPVAGLLRLARSSEVMLGRRRGKVRGFPGRELVALLRERLTALAGAAAAPPAAPLAALARLACGLLARVLRLFPLGAHGGVFGLSLLLVVVLFVLLLDRNGGRRLQCQRLRLLQAVHLLALLDDERQLPAHGGVGIDHNGDAEAFLQHA